jgi:HD-GYP domain-containing protein (c-di-GMP phosphodiesterase class II)
LQRALPKRHPSTVRFAVTAATTIATADLQVGMFVHLDLGWMSHPFALSSFRIADAGQIATIRSLGLARVRWSPQHSDSAVLAGTEAPALTAPAPLDSALPAPTAPAPLDADPAAAQRRAASVVERQYAEAARDWRAAADRVEQDAPGAGARMAALSRALVSKMLSARELSIRAVSAAPAEDACHALNVGVLALLMGRACGLSETELEDLGVGAMTHDIGKSGLPTALHKLDTHFTAAETARWRDHVARGVALGQRMGLAPSALLVIAQHHEHMDGSGFPQGHEGQRISLPSRVAALVNRYDNLCHPSKRTLPMTPHEAVSWMFAQGQRHYDPTLLRSFVRMMGVYPPGSVVQLTDDRYAVVESVSASRPLKPQVQAYDPVQGQGAQALQWIDLATLPTLGIRRALPAAQLPSAVRSHLAPPRRSAWFFETHDDGTSEEDDRLPVFPRNG